MSIIIIGAGGHARVVLDLLALLRAGSLIGLLDDDAALAGTSLDGVPVLGPISLLSQLMKPQNIRQAAIAVGDNSVRRQLMDKIQKLGIELPPFIHPAAIISPRAAISPGTIICAGAIVGPGAQIGPGCIINTRASVDHDCKLDDCVHIGPGATLTGNVHIGDCTLVGAGVTIIPQVNIGKDCVIGAGATVLHDVPYGLTVAGCPAKPIPPK